MTDRDLYNEVKEILLSSGTEDASFDARQIVNASSAFENSRETALEFARRRASHEPLQYILGTWEFMGIEFMVTPAVLIPRADTETLCEFALSKLKGIPSPTVFDLCAGSGCIGLSLAKLSGALVTLFEKSHEAAAVLRQNRDTVSPTSKVVECDVLTCPLPTAAADMIVCNPPYIKSGVINTLSREVKKEPLMALDGGEDGLLFYREIAARWKPALKTGGTLAFEIGYDQRSEVTDIMTEAGYKNVMFLRDLGGNDRVVYGNK